MKKKVLVLALAVSLVALTALGVTLAYFTDTKTATNTFTMGNVNITLTELKFPGGPGGGTISNVTPGDSITKDPTVTNTGANAAYVRLKVTVTKSSEFDAALPNADLTTLFSGYAPSVWLYKGNTEDTVANTRTYTFWYNGVLAPTAAAAPLFTAVNIPAGITSGQASALSGFQIIVKAEAIQADNFVDNTTGTAMENAFTALGA